MIIAGIILNGIVFGLCYRPLEVQRSRRTCREVPASNIMKTIAKEKRIRTQSECSASDGIVITTENHFLAKVSEDPKDDVDPVEALITGSNNNAHHTPANQVGSRISVGSRKSNGMRRRSIGASQRSIQDKAATELANPMIRQDALLVGSHRNLAEFKKSSNNIETYTKSITNFPDPEESAISKITNFLLNMFDFSLLKSFTFILLCSSGVLVFIGLYTPFVYVVQKAKVMGIEEAERSNILLILGICNTVSRVITGLISDIPKVDVIVVQNVAAVLAGVATCLVAVLNSFPLLCIYAAFFGVNIAAFIALRSIVMVEMLGLKKLNNAFGLTSLFQGIAVLIGSPMSGIYKKTFNWLTYVRYL
jgi:hypothetical protein